MSYCKNNLKNNDKKMPIELAQENSNIVEYFTNPPIIEVFAPGKEQKPFGEDSDEEIEDVNGKDEESSSESEISSSDSEKETKEAKKLRKKIKRKEMKKKIKQRIIKKIKKKQEQRKKKQNQSQSVDAVRFKEFYNSLLPTIPEPIKPPATISELNRHRRTHALQEELDSNPLSCL